MRRMSDRDGEGSGPAPQLDGRRNSVVTMERVIPTLFVRNRQLDIMDDIADLRARKVRLRMYRTSTEQVYEIQPLEGNSSAQRYTEQPKQRLFEMPTLSVSPTSSLRKRVSELPRAASASVSGAAGIVCSNTDLISILSSVGSSATEINRCDEEAPSSLDDSRSNWPEKTTDRSNGAKSELRSGLSLRFDKLKVVKAVKKMFGKKSPNSEVNDKVVWDNTSGTKVDAQVFGSAIEKMLTAQKGNDTEIPRASGSSGKPSVSPNKPMSGKVTNWF
ncbi:uncharacterized protein LOC126920796 [Bombus affinis]|uniref:uncharacterized protein LOC126920796 n=1 Tax=Bombus affinis TaxID=309941 RepID=UPI0021B82426|nr:uncharacterized protein LOC126920796 [Bombus affinis]